MKRTVIIGLAAAFLSGCSLGKMDISSLTAGKSTGEDQTAQAKPVPADKLETRDNTCKGRQAAQVMAERAIITIKAKFASGAPSEFGAGIIVSAKGSSLYILTANHVVRKPGAGAASVEVTITDGIGSHRTVPAKIMGSFSPSEPYTDLALLQAEAGRTGEALSALDWAILREARYSNDLKNFVIIGNPAGGGKTTTPPGDADFRNAAELHINSGVMQPGYSGGGVFDAARHLAGIVFEDRGQYAAAYPIEPVLALIRMSGVPVDLKTATASKKEIYLSDVDASSPELKQAATSAIGKALESAGFEPFCPSAGAFKVAIFAKAIKTSGTTAIIELQPTFFDQNGGAVRIEKEQVSLTFFVGFSPLSSPEELEAKLKQGAEKLVSKISKKMG